MVENIEADRVRPQAPAVVPRRDCHATASIGGRVCDVVPGPVFAPVMVSPTEARLAQVHEAMHVECVAPERLDARTAHLVLLALLLAGKGEGALAQAVAARRHGASADQVRSVAALAGLLHGEAAAQRGKALVVALADWERAERVAGAVAAYG